VGEPEVGEDIAAAAFFHGEPRFLLHGWFRLSLQYRAAASRFRASHWPSRLIVEVAGIVRVPAIMPHNAFMGLCRTLEQAPEGFMAPSQVLTEAP
jgi:hypothetical protein